MKPYDILITHVLSTLPDSISKRRALLGAVLDVTTEKHPLRMPVAKMLNALADHERAQAELPLGWVDGK